MSSQCTHIEVRALGEEHFLTSLSGRTEALPPEVVGGARRSTCRKEEEGGREGECYYRELREGGRGKKGKKAWMGGIKARERRSGKLYT